MLHPISISAPALGLHPTELPFCHAYNKDIQGIQSFFNKKGLVYTDRTIVNLDASTQKRVKTFGRLYADVKKLVDHKLPGTELDDETLTLSAQYEHCIKNNIRPDLAICFINDEVGHGIFALSPIGANHLIGEYTGVVYHTSLLLKGGYYLAAMEKPMQASHLMHSNTELNIDAETYGNETRFINHVESGRILTDSLAGGLTAANCMMRSFWYKGLPRIILTATRDIKVGEELRFDYGASYLPAIDYSTETYWILDGKLTQMPTERPSKIKKNNLTD